MINLKIDPEFQSQIPPLTDDEFKQLEENILKEGKLLSPLIVWSIGSPVEMATTSTQLLLRKPPRRNCVKLTQFLPPLRKRASASRLQSGTMSANPMLPGLKSSCGAWRSWSR